MRSVPPPRTVGLVVAGLWLAHAGPALAFFPPVATAPEPVTVLPPLAAPAVPSAAPPVTPPIVPPLPPLPFVPTPTREVPQEVPPEPECCCQPPTPHVVPEPASMVSAVAGLVAVGAAVRRRKTTV